MARKGTTSHDYRSEAERIGPRSDTVSAPEEDSSHVSDRVLEEVVRKRLGLEPELATSDVTVQATNGRVILAGTADTLNTKYRIEEFVKRIDGVQKVENNLSIRVGEHIEEFSHNADAARLRQQEARRLRGER